MRFFDKEKNKVVPYFYNMLFKFIFCGHLPNMDWIAAAYFRKKGIAAGKTCRSYFCLHSAQILVYSKISNKNDVLTIFQFCGMIFRAYGLIIFITI